MLQNRFQWALQINKQTLKDCKVCRSGIVRNKQKKNWHFSTSFNQPPIYQHLLCVPEGILIHRTWCNRHTCSLWRGRLWRASRGQRWPSRQQPDKAAGGRRNGWPQSGRHQIEWQHANEHMFWAVDYDRAQLFPVQLHFQFPAQHFSFITVISG